MPPVPKKVAAKKPPTKKPVAKAVVDLSPIRARLATLMDLTIKNEPNWHYKEARPLNYPTLPQAEHETVVADCSFGCSILCKLADAGDPLGSHFNGYGNSVSMFSALAHIVNPLDVQIGDMAVLGDEGRLHAMMVRRTGADPLMWSHGSESGPKYVPLSDETRYHLSVGLADGGVVTFLRLAA